MVYLEVIVLKKLDPVFACVWILSFRVCSLTILSPLSELVEGCDCSSLEMIGLLFTLSDICPEVICLNWF
jgi:hypothetical protein